MNHNILYIEDEMQKNSWVLKVQNSTLLCYDKDGVSDRSHLKDKYQYFIDSKVWKVIKNKKRIAQIELDCYKSVGQTGGNR